MRAYTLIAMLSLTAGCSGTGDRQAGEPVPRQDRRPISPGRAAPAGEALGLQFKPRRCGRDLQSTLPAPRRPSLGLERVPSFPDRGSVRKNLLNEPISSRARTQLRRPPNDSLMTESSSLQLTTYII